MLKSEPLFLPFKLDNYQPGQLDFSIDQEYSALRLYDRLRAGGKPNPGTPKDRRLKQNKPARPSQPKPGRKK